tara:strand:+ start:2340 stop:2507 length:168 start_codon:yes stop_codon:yes gene_type:complete
MIDKINFALLDENRALKRLQIEVVKENKTNGERQVMHREIYALKHSINILNNLKG